MSDLVEYPQGERVPGRDRAHRAGVEPRLAGSDRGRKDGAPNVLFLVLDDVGYGQLSCFGGLVETPNIDRVAASGLRYANMHTTALCSPTRATILTGRNHHSSGVACIMELATGYPGLRRADAVRERHAPRDAGAGGLQRVLPRQVAPVALGGEHAGGPVPPLAARPRVRALLRLPRRRDQPVVSGPHARQRADAPAEGPGGRLPPQRGPRRPGDQARARRARQRAREAVLHVLRARVRRTRRTTSARSGPTGTRAGSTAAGTPTARRSSRARRRSGCCPPRRSSRRATPTSRSGRRSPPTSGGCTRG